MKKILCVAAIALAAFVGMTGCDNPSDAEDKKDPVVTYSTWWIKGSFDNWAENPKHFFVVDELDANKLSFDITGVYKDDICQFVLVNPDGKQYKIEGADRTITMVTPGTEFLLGESAATNSTTKANVGFTVAKSTYTVRVEISNAAAPKVNLIAGSEDSPTVSNELLLEKLKIKGDQFSKINEATVGGWTATAGAITGNTMTWDLLVTNKNGSFGFDSLNGFLQGVTPNVAALTVGVPEPATSLLISGGNCAFKDIPFSGAVYTIAVTVDGTKTVANGRYSMVVTLKTASTTAWAFDPWTTLYFVGTINTTDWTHEDAKTYESGVGTFEFTASADSEQFKLTDQPNWDGKNIGFSGITVASGSLALTDAGGDIGIAVTSGTTYVITVDFTADSYKSSGNPVVSVAAK